MFSISCVVHTDDAGTASPCPQGTVGTPRETQVPGLQPWPGLPAGRSEQGCLSPAVLTLFCPVPERGHWAWASKVQSNVERKNPHTGSITFLDSGAS